MKIVLPGGSGQVGTLLARAFVADGHEVVVLSRRPEPAAWKVVAWDGETVGPWAAEIDGSDVVINLAGRSVDCRYTAANRRAILESRVRSTRAVGRAIAAAARPPRVWLQSSTATIYAHRYDAPNDEAKGFIGGDEPGSPDTWRFSIEVAKAWEAAARESSDESPESREAAEGDDPRREFHSLDSRPSSLDSPRLVLLRSAMTMSPDRGGVFDVLLGLVRRGLGGTVGDGKQYVSWIHERDFARAIYWLIDHDLAGPVNLAAPNPVPYAEFMRTLRRAWGIRFGLPATRWMLEVGTFLLRTESELVLKSRRVVPGRLLESGFTFEFPTWDAAAADLCRRWKEARPGRYVGQAVPDLRPLQPPMLTPDAARAFAAEWIDAWNAHDLPRILSHYRDDFRMTTPFIARIAGEPSGTFVGKAAVGVYWVKALERMPDLKFELLDVTAGVDTVCIYYRSVLGLRAVEWLRLDADGKVVEAIAHYHASP